MSHDSTRSRWLEVDDIEQALDTVLSEDVEAETLTVHPEPGGWLVRAEIRSMDSDTFEWGEHHFSEDGALVAYHHHRVSYGWYCSSPVTERVDIDYTAAPTPTRAYTIQPEAARADDPDCTGPLATLRSTPDPGWGARLPRDVLDPRLHPDHRRPARRGLTARAEEDTLHTARDLAVAAALLVLGGCTTPRPLDPEPVRTPLERPLPEGELRVRLSPATEGDQGRRVQAGLLLTVESGAHRYVQLIASCDEVATGNVDPPEPGGLAAASCDARTLTARKDGDAVMVRDDRGDALARVPLR